MRAPNKSVEGPLVEAARELAHGHQGLFSRAELVNKLSDHLPAIERRRRRKLYQAVISRLLGAGFFLLTQEHQVLRFRSLRAPLPWDSFQTGKRLAAIAHIRSRLRSIADMDERERSSPGLINLRRSLNSRLRRLERLLLGPHDTGSVASIRTAQSWREHCRPSTASHARAPASPAGRASSVL
jgi:hypothetical protein